MSAQTPTDPELLAELKEATAELRAYTQWADVAGVRIVSAAPAQVQRPAHLESPPVRGAPQYGLPTQAPSALPRAPSSPPPSNTTMPPKVPSATALPLPVLVAGGANPTLDSVRTELGECTRCKLHKTRTKIVYGVGSPKAKLVFVGEAPGEDEDLSGEPFVGKAGQLLTKMIEAMGLSRDTVYICNTTKCRPPNNRNPEPDELSACEPFLVGQLAALKPQVIVTLGKFAAQALLRDQTPISRLRGEWREYQGIPLMPTFHPAYLLRSPGEKGKVWADLQLVMKKLGLPAKGA
ncbi:MAG: uracil-DNA glycosylase [Deltaproteobacteria bacterium]|nr:uracil-DNA glycosylase [Deltaproteobacteria bacterium]